MNSLNQPEPVYLDPARVAAAIGGKAKGNKITAHAPGHKKGAPELEILIEPTAPRGLLVRCYSGEDPVAMKDWILRQCGEPEFAPTTKTEAPAINVRPLVKSLDAPKRFYDEHLIRQGYTIAAEYDYADPHGEVMFQVVRYEGEGLDKTFLQRHPDSRGGWFSGRGEPILYRWPEIASRPTEPVYVTEGEKDADALLALGLLATTAPNGSWPDDLSPLKGRKLFVMPDNDKAGEKKAAEAIEKLMGVATVRRVDLPDLPHKGDVSDWLAAGGTVEQLKTLAESAPLIAANENSPGRFKIDWFGDIEEDLPKETFIKGVFGVGEFTMLSGKPGTGKSVIVTDMACHVAAGKDWDGRKVKQGLVVYVAAERKDLTKRRMLAFRKTHGLGHIPLAVISGRIDMTTGLKDAEELSAAITKLEQDCGQKCSWVIIDTLTRVFGPGDQNTSKDMGRFIHSCDTIMENVGAALTVIHHTGHQGDRAKGAIDLDGAVDASFMVKKEAGGYILECDGANDSAEGVIARFKMEGVQVGTDEDGEPTMAPVVVPLDAKDSGTRLVENFNANQAKALEVLQGLSSDGAPVPQALWRRAFYAEFPGVKEDTLKQRFKRARESLVDAGKVVQDGDGFRVSS